MDNGHNNNTHVNRNSIQPNNNQSDTDFRKVIKTDMAETKEVPAMDNDSRPFNEPPYGPNRDRRDTDFRRVMGAQMDEMAELLRGCDDDVSMDML